MRKNNYDTLKGILIILVIFAHMLLSYDYYQGNNLLLIIKCIYSFHMPLFFIISGYFSRNKKDLKKIINYFVVFLLMHSSFCIFDFIKNGNIDIFYAKYSSWYILLLALYRLFIYKDEISELILKKYSLIVIFVISIITGFLTKNATVSRLFMFFYFFAFGYRSNYKISKEKSEKLLFISIVTLITITIGLNVRLDLLMGSYYENIYEAIIRSIILISDTTLFVGLMGLIGNKKVPMVTEIGKNSIYIYIFHRIPTLIFGYIFYSYNHYLLISIFISIILILIINYLSKYLKVLLNNKVALPISIILLLIPLIFYNYNHELTPSAQDKIDNSISIGFVGDLILLEDQLKLSNNNFDYMFNNTKKYIKDTDYVFGVLEGPVDDDADYSYGNYSDSKELRLNYPTSFLRAIEDSGIDFVTIVNNHIFDRGIDSYKNTLDNLNNSNLDYIGSKNNIKIVDIKGLKVGVLAYTYGLNYLSNNDYTEYIDFLAKPYSKEFKDIKNNIHKDFEKLKENKVDLIVVLPHYGTEFSNKIDTYQEVWNNIFINEGANIILGDHSHAIEPIQYKNDAIIINSPGNYINSYIEHNGDISMYVKIYLDKESHKIISSSITPIIATKDEAGKYHPVLLEESSEENQERTINLLEDTIFNNQIHDIKNTYYYFKKDSYKYKNKYNLVLNDDDKNTLVYRIIEEHNKICFIGDSITEGTKNNYNPWYLPLMSYFDKEVVNISKGGYTSFDVLENFSETIKESNCDLSIINIGTNDIRYNSESVDKYINNIKKIIELTSGEVIILAPWQTTDKDYNIDKKDTKKRALYSEYNNELSKLENVYYVDPNPYIKEVLEYNGEEEYLIDGIHPNDNIGLKLYSLAVLREDNNLITYDIISFES